MSSKLRILFSLLIFFSRSMSEASQPTFAELYGNEFTPKSTAADALHEQAWRLFYDGKYQEATSCLDHALHAAGEPFEDLVILHNTKVDAALLFGDVQSATEQLNQTRSLLTKLSSLDHPFSIRLAISESGLSLHHGDIDTAKTRLGDAERMAARLNLTNRPVFALLLRAKGVMQMAQAQFSDAADTFERSSTFLERTSAAESWIVDHNRLLMGVSYGRAGDYRGGELFARRALENLTRKLPSSHMLVVVARSQYAGLLQQGGRTEDALDQLKESVTSLIEAAGKTNAAVARAYLGLGTLQLSADRPGEALFSFDQALGIDWRLAGAESPAVAFDLDGIGLAELATGEPARAVKSFTTSAEVLAKAVGTNDLNFATVICNLGQAHFENGDLANARNAFLYGMEIQHRSLGFQHPFITQGQENLGLLAALRGDSLQAVNWLRISAKGKHRWLSGQVLGDSQAAALRSIENAFQTLELYNAFVSLVVGTNRIKVVTEGAILLAGSKALLEESLLIRKRLELGRFAHLRSQRERLNWLNSQIAEFGDSLTSSSQRSGRELIVERESIESEIIKSDALTERVLQSDVLLSSCVGQALPSKAVLLDFVCYRGVQLETNGFSWADTRYAVYLTGAALTGSASSPVVRYELGSAKIIDDVIAEFHRLITERRIADRRLQPLLNRLGNLILGPITNDLPQFEHLIVCPAGQISVVPFEALRNPATDRYLIEDKRISYVSSGREVARIAQPRTSTPTNAPVVMGFPDFDLPLAAIAGELAGQPIRPDSSASFVGNRTPATLSRDALGQHFDPLPDTEREARAAAKLLGEDCVLRLGADACEAELKRVVSPRILHLATHGFYLTDQEFRATNSLPDLLAGSFGPRLGRRNAGEDWENPLIRCGIALAGANHAGSLTNATAEDGILTGLEASLLNLQGTELVILSACQTGAGDVRIGEGVMSLRRAFTIAGAQSVLASHWRVSDEATNRLITEFLHHWSAGKPRVEALREAQLSLLRSKEYSSPYFWAAFTLTGRWD